MSAFYLFVTIETGRRAEKGQGQASVLSETELIEIDVKLSLLGGHISLVL